MSTRRQFLQAASVAGVAATLPRALSGMRRPGLIRVPAGNKFAVLGLEPDDPKLHALAMRALDAAKSAGAQYADVRLTRTRVQNCSWLVDDFEQLAVGVRALVNGAWGFVASPDWTMDEMVRIGTQAAAQAVYNKWRPGAGIDLGAPPPMASGTWSTHVVRDAFDVSVEEKLDFVHGVQDYGIRKSHINSVIMGLQFAKQERTFASTEGAYATQVFHTLLSGWSDLNISVQAANGSLAGSRSPDFFGPIGAGYEVLSEINFFDVVDHLVEDLRQIAAAQGPDIGRYDIVFDPYAMAALVGETVGQALEVDRARGFEANAGGTSYLAPLTDVLGKRQLAPKALTVHANRSMPRGAATARWDDDGVATHDFELISNGVVVDYATSRQHLAAMTPWYTGEGHPVASHGCSAGETAMDMPVVATPNLVMQPAAASTSFEELIADTPDGYAVIGGSWNMDHQKLTGQGRGAMVRRIHKGKLGPAVMGAAFLVRSPDLWKNLIAIGGPGSERIKGFEASKGQPKQSYTYSVSAVPAKIGNISVIDLRRQLSAL